MAEPSDNPIFQEVLKKLFVKAQDQKAVEYQQTLIKWAFENGWKAGQKELIDHAKRIVEVDERSKVDDVILGVKPEDNIPF